MWMYTFISLTELGPGNAKIAPPIPPVLHPLNSEVLISINAPMDMKLP